jgi:hypothetical protein
MTDISSSGRSYLDDDGLQAEGADSLMSSLRFGIALFDKTGIKGYLEPLIQFFVKDLR